MHHNKSARNTVNRAAGNLKGTHEAQILITLFGTYTNITVPKTPVSDTRIAVIAKTQRFKSNASISFCHVLF